MDAKRGVPTVNLLKLLANFQICCRGKSHLPQIPAIVSGRKIFRPYNCYNPSRPSGAVLCVTVGVSPRGFKKFTIFTFLFSALLWLDINQKKSGKICGNAVKTGKMPKKSLLNRLSILPDFSTISCWIFPPYRMPAQKALNCGGANAPKVGKQFEGFRRRQAVEM